MDTFMSTSGAVYSNPPETMHHLSIIHPTHGDAATYHTTAHKNVTAYQTTADAHLLGAINIHQFVPHRAL